MAVVNLDDPSDVAAWNCRAPAPASQPVATPAGMEPVATVLFSSTGWRTLVDALASLEDGTKLYTAAQVQAMLAAAPSGTAREPLTTEEQMHKDLAALCKRIFNARIGKACSNCDGGTYQSDNNGYGQFHRCNKFCYVPMWGEDGRELGAPIAAAQKVNNA